jgi:hypothetical protein
MTDKAIKFALMMLATWALIAVLAVAWELDLIPGKVRSYGTATARDGTILDLRQVHRPGKASGAATSQVKLPSGRWVDYQPDCETSYRNAQR